MSKIILNRLDYARIKKCISDAKQFISISNVESENLLKELDSAKVVEAEAIPSNVVTKIRIDEIIYQPEAAGVYNL